MQKKQNKLSMLLLLFFIWTVLSFSTENPDISSYKNIYTYLSETNIFFYEGFEKGFSILMKSCSLLGLNYQGFLIVVASITTFLIYRIVNKYSLNPSLVLVLFIFFPFFLDVVQIRNYIASLIVLNLIPYLVSKEYTKYIIGIILASLFHISAIFYLLFLLVSISKDKLMYIVVLVTLGFVVVQNLFINQLFALLPNSQKYIIYSDTTKLSTLVFFVIIFLVNVYLISKLAVNVKELNHKFSFFSDEQIKIIDIIEKINIIIIFSFALIALDINFYRIYRNIFLLNYILFSNTFYKGKVLRNNHFVLNQLLYTFFIFIFGYLFLYVNQIEVVIKAILESIKIMP